MICKDDLMVVYGCVLLLVNLQYLNILISFTGFQNYKFVVLSTKNLMWMEFYHRYNNTHNN
jgi:hypothetical protein